MFKIIQSNDTQKLAQILIKFYKDDPRYVLEPFVVIVPAKVLESWLSKIIARQLGVSSLLMTQFWGQYQWQMITQVLSDDKKYLQRIGKAHNALVVPEVAMLSQTVIRWKIFAYLMGKTDDGQYQINAIIDDDKHPLYPLLSSIYDKDGYDKASHKNSLANQRNTTLPKERYIGGETLWQLADNLARVFVKYLTERNDWLDLWAKNKAVNVDKLIQDKEKFEQQFSLPTHSQLLANDTPHSQHTDTTDNTDDSGTPVWLQEYYVQLEQALRFLWRWLFADIYEQRQRFEQRFWQILENPQYFGGDEAFEQQVRRHLPKQLYLFTIQQMPQIELDFLKRLSVHCDVVLLHFNPSMMYWADIVDKNWLAVQRIFNPQSVYLKDHGHTLLSRLGKASRNSFAMLVHMAGGEMAEQDVKQGLQHRRFAVSWDDEFDEVMSDTPTLLERLKQGILMLEDDTIGQYHDFDTDNFGIDKQTLKNVLKIGGDEFDDSLMIHNCHSLKRQLEVARLYIGKWLNEPNRDGTSRQLSDVLILMPDVQSHESLIRSVFGHQKGLDGLVLPAKITGVADQNVAKLWQAIIGLFKLPNVGRLYRDDFFDWLMLDAVHQSFGLSFEMAQRACQLLTMAGFVRGLDEYHLGQTLDKDDKDYRHCLAYALDRLVVSLSVGGGLSDMFYPFKWQAGMAEKSLAIVGVALQDEPVIKSLCHIYQALLAQRGQYHTHQEMIVWLDYIEKQVIDYYFIKFKATDPMKSIFGAKNAMKMSVLANQNTHHKAFELPLQFVLEALEEAVLGQQISAEFSEVINFGRFGSMRGMRFELVLMLGMEMSAFPRLDSISRLDLTKAGVSRLGDRVSEEDDNGAFLEALFQAHQACWIFYNGQSLVDETTLLPASPVGELLGFLKDSGLSDEDIDSKLIKKHPALPFDDSYFQVEGGGVKADSVIDKTLPPPLLWQQVHHALKHKHALGKDTSHLATTEQIQAIYQWLNDVNHRPSNLEFILDIPDKWALSSLISRVKNPANAYLKGKVIVEDTANQKTKTQKDETLSLDGLGRYQLVDELLGNTQANQMLYYQNTLPAGVARLTSYETVAHIVSTLKQELIKHTQMMDDKMGFGVRFDEHDDITPLTTRQLPLTILGRRVVIEGKCPQDNQAVWYALKANQLNDKSRLEAFLSHLFWQALRQDNQDNLANNMAFGSSFWQFYDKKADGTHDKTTNKATKTNNKKDNKDNKDNLKDPPSQSFVMFLPIPSQQAQILLQRWVAFAWLLSSVVVPLLPKYAQTWLFNQEDFANNAYFRAICDQISKSNLDDLQGLNDHKAYEQLTIWLRAWQAPPSEFTSDENTSQHDSWQRLFGQADSMALLIHSLPLAPLLYQTMGDVMILGDLDA